MKIDADCFKFKIFSVIFKEKNQRLLIIENKAIFVSKILNIFLQMKGESYLSIYTP